MATQHIYHAQFDNDMHVDEGRVMADRALFQHCVETHSSYSYGHGPAILIITAPEGVDVPSLVPFHVDHIGSFDDGNGTQSSTVAGNQMEPNFGGEFDN